MITSLSATRRSLAPFALAGLLAGCDGGGGNVVRFSFGTSNVAACRGIRVNVDIANANAELARRSDGSPDCTVDALLDDCDATFEEINDGATLSVTIDDCEIPLITTLFSCGFREGDLASLEQQVDAGCECEDEPKCHYNSVCDQDPVVCVDEVGGAIGCEDCENGIDDDGNGDVDCDDDDCLITDVCGWGWTTITCTSTTGPTMTTVPLPTTTLPVENCSVVFRLASEVTVGSLQWTTGYAGAHGTVAGSGAQVACMSLVDGALAAFNDDDGTETLESGLVKVDGFTGPLDVAECDFEASAVPQKSDFVISDVEAATPDLELIVPDPDVVIGAIDCGHGVTTTTAPQTTTTLDTTTTTAGGATAYDVLFRLDSASAGVGALQWTADYTAASGGFEGSGASVACTNKVVGALFAPNDVDATSRLTLGIIALSPFNAPTDLVECVFAGVAGDAPVPGDFAITIDDATDTDGTPISAAISVVVTPQ